MKKLFLIITLLFSIALMQSCKKSDENLKAKTHFNPPAWIQGNWGVKGLSENPTVIFRFTKDNFFSIAGVYSEIDYNGYVNNYNEAGHNIKVKEDINSTSYQIKIIINKQATTTFKFIKVNENKIIDKDNISETTLIRI